MTIRYPCDECGKEFNFRIKLNRHIATKHKEPTTPESEAFLQPGAALSDADKIKYFDTLKLKLQELISKVSKSEKKFEYLQGKLKSLEKVKCKSSKSEQSKTFRGAASVSGSYEQIESDLTIPVGWKSAYKLMDASFGKDTKIKVYWGPNGRFFSSRRQAINYMIAELESSPADVELMRNGFCDDGWIEDKENLPKGWLCKSNSDSKLFLTDDYTLLRGQRAVLKYMAVKNSDDEIGRFLCKYFLKNEITPSNIMWMVSDAIPFPWRVANITYNSGVKNQIITSPDGQLFSCWKTAVDFIEKSEDMKRKDLESFVNFVEKANYEKELSEHDWVPDLTLPEGWRKLKERYTRYLSPTGETFSTRSAALEFLKKMGIEIVTEVKVKKEKLPNPIKIERPVVDWQEDDSVPENWSVGVIEGTEVKKYKDPKGAVFLDRVGAIRSMFNDPDCSENDMKVMKAGLIEDGWVNREFLPTGWMMRKRRRLNRKGKSDYTVYLSPEYEVLQAFESVYQQLKKSGCSDKELMTFKEQCSYKWKKGDFLPKGWMFSLVAMGNGSGTTFKVYLSPSGKYFAGLLPILRDYQDKFENPSDKNKFLALMYGKGWFTTEYLPTGWMCKPKDHKGGMIYTDSEYTKLKNTKALIKHMMNQGVDPEVISSFRKNWKNLMSKSCDIEDAEESMETDANDDEESCGLTWTDNPILPSGWKIAISEIAKGPLAGRKCYRFMTKDGDLYGSRTEAFKAIINDAGVDMEEINLFKKGFTQEGWETKEFMPENWLVRKQSFGSSYMTPTGEVLASSGIALHYLIENEYSIEEVDMFKEKECPANTIRKRAIKQEPRVNKEESKKYNILDLLPNVTVSKFKEERSPNRESSVENKPKEDNLSGSKIQEKSRRDPKVSYHWKSDGTLPNGWKSSLRESALASIKDLKIKMYLSPDGRISGSRPQALRYMTTNPLFTQNDIDEMKKGLSDEGWFSKDFLPAGWMIKALNNGHCIVLTDTFETLKSIRKVASYMDLKSFIKDDIGKVKDGLCMVLKEIGQKGQREIGPRAVSEASDIGQKRKMFDSDDRKASATESHQQPKILKSGFELTMNNGFSKGNTDTDWTPGDETLPVGWKMRHNQSLDKVQFLSRKNKTFISRAEAYKYMYKNSTFYSSKEMEELKSKLQYEFWEDHHLMPEGWKLKKIEGSAVFFLSEIGGFIRTIRGARENVKKRNSPQELSNFDVLMELLKPTNRENMGQCFEPIGLGKTLTSRRTDEGSIRVKNEPMEISTATPKVKKEKDYINSVGNSLPVGWTQKMIPGSDDVVFTSPEDKTLYSRLALVEFLVKSKHDPQTIYTFWNTLDVEGWALGDELVPPGWRMKFHKSLFDYKYLTREMTVVNSSEEALKHIAESGEYSQENLQNFKKWYSNLQEAMPKINWESDDSLPSGWKMASGPEFEIIKDKNGALFESRKEAIDHMIKEQYTPSNIFNLWNTLHLEGWINDELHLPTGWKRKFYPEKNSYHYLSPMMEVVKCGDTLFNIVKAGKEYTEEEVEKVQSWLKDN